MKLSLEWLQQYIDLPEDPHELGEVITMHIAEVEEVIDQAASLNHVVVGEVIEARRHENADKLNVGLFDVGEETPRQIVFGGKAILEPGQKLPIALPGAVVGPITIAERKLRGEESRGMCCLNSELGILDNEERVHFFDASVANGTPVAEALGLTDVIIDIENKTLTHRGDLFNHVGFARELSVVLERPLKLESLPEVKPGAETELKVVIEDATVCNRYIGAVLHNVEIKPSPDWMQKRLEAIGVKTINNVVDITNYVMYEYGQPLHAFDYNKLTGGAINVRFSQEGETLHTLDGKEREFDATPIPVIADAEKPVALAGMMGGLNSEVDSNTTTIALESANFNPVTIRLGAQHQAVRTDGSTRHEKNLGIQFPELGFARAVQLLEELAGATVSSNIVDMGNYSTEHTVISDISIQHDIARVIGSEVEKAEVNRILTGLGLTLEFSSEDVFTATVPLTRKDLTIKEDIVEEIARMKGYDNIEPAPLLGGIEPPVTQPDVALGNRLIQLFAQWGANEVMNYSFYSAEDVERMQGDTEAHTSVLNPMNPDQQYLRQTPVAHLLRNMSLNLHNHYTKPILAEYGHLYISGTELATVSVAAQSTTPDAFYTVKGYVEQALAELNVPATYEDLTESHERENHNYAVFDPAADGIYRTQDGEQVATIGVVRASISEQYDVPGFVAVAILHLERLADFTNSTLPYTVPSKYPAIDLDISIEVDESVAWAKIIETIQQSGGELVSRVELFDRYQGKGVEDGKVALGIRIWLQSTTRTLEMKEAEQLRETMLKALAASVSAIHRK